MLRKVIIAATLFPIIAVAESTQRFPAYVLQAPASVRTILVAETGASRLLRYERRDDGIKLSHTSYMSIGQNGDGKETDYRN